MPFIKWRALRTPQEREAVCQIENEKIKSLSTAGLIKICTNYPFFMSYGLYSSPIKGFESSMVSFNGYTELMNRENVISEIMDFLMAENFDKLEQTKDSTGRGR